MVLVTIFRNGGFPMWFILLFGGPRVDHKTDLQEVLAYRSQVDSAVRSFLPHASADLLDLIELGLNHEQQHQELIVTDIKHALWSSPLQPAYVPDPKRHPGKAQPLSWKSWDEGVYEVGHASGSGFAFDNEEPRHKVYLQSFELASRCVTNREYLEFMNAGGYQHAELWLSDGWDQLTANGWNAPLYWEQREGECARLVRIRSSDGMAWWRSRGVGAKRCRTAQRAWHCFEQCAGSGRGGFA